MEGRFFVSEGRSDWFAPDIAIYRCDFEGAQFDDSLFDRYVVDCPASVRRSVPKRRAEYLAGRYCAREALHELGMPAAQIGTGAHRAPQWPSSVVGSISHSDGCAVAAVSWNARYRGIGIDIERRVSDETFDNIEKAVLVASERTLLPLLDEARRDWFTLIFSLKESFFKAAFATVGYYFDFDAVTVLNVDHAHGSVRFRTNYALGDRLPSQTLLHGSFRLLAQGRVVTCVTLARN